MTEFQLGTLAVVAVLTLLPWAISIALRNASIVDAFWGVTIVAIAWVHYVRGYLLQGPACLPEQCEFTWPPPIAGLIVALVTIWGLRFSLYVGWRTVGSGESERQRALRARLGARFALNSLFTVFLVQTLLAWVVALPAQGAYGGGSVSEPLLVGGVVLWAFGFSFEALGDLQLAWFRRDPANRGRVMDRGLWRYSRHPNYFGDLCVWWGLYLIAAANWQWWTVVGPIVLSVLLVGISGPALERSIARRRPGYPDYARVTSPFLPLPPKDH
jgi:steroid 5-alpha reductase family enzyme